MTRPPRRDPARDAVVAEQDGLDVRRVGHAAHDDVRRGRHGGRRGAPPGAQLDQLRGAARGPVPDRDLEPGAAQVGGHRRPHRAQPDEPDSLHARPPAWCAEGTRRDDGQIRCGDGVAGGRAAPPGDGPARVRARSAWSWPGSSPPASSRAASPRATSTTGSRPTRRGSARRSTGSRLDRQAGDHDRPRRGDAQHDVRADRRGRGGDRGPGRGLGRARRQPRLQHPRPAAARRRGRSGSASSAPGCGRSRA